MHVRKAFSHAREHFEKSRWQKTVFVAGNHYLNNKSDKVLVEINSIRLGKKSNLDLDCFDSLMFIRQHLNVRLKKKLHWNLITLD